MKKTIPEKIRKMILDLYFQGLPTGVIAKVLRIAEVEVVKVVRPWY